jgi:hypothetical protein
MDKIKIVITKRMHKIAAMIKIQPKKEDLPKAVDVLITTPFVP